MSVDAGTEPQGDGSVNESGTGEDNRPPYADQLAKFPMELQPMAEGIFKEWDAGVTKRIQELHSAQEPWKEVIDSYDPQQAQEAINLAYYMENNPKEFFDAFSQAYGFTPGAAPTEQGQGGSQQQQTTEQTPAQGSETPDPYAERFGQLETTVRDLATILVNQQNITSAQESQKLLDGVMADIKEKNPGVNEQFILNQLAMGADPETAVKNYNSTIEEAIAARGYVPGQTQAPTVMSGSGGGTPSLSDGGKRVGELSSKEVQSLVVQRLEAAARENS